MPDPAKFTEDYIAKTDSETLNQERKELIRHYTACQTAASKLREALAARGEVEHAAEELARMSSAKRDAIRKALGSAKTTGSGKVS